MNTRKTKDAVLNGAFLRRGAHCWEATATPLPEVIRKGGFELTMIRRNDRAAIYRQHLPGGNADHDAYEVILPQTRDTDHTGEPVEPYEGYPAAESWSTKGWTFTDLAKALQKLNELPGKASRTGTVSRRNRRTEQGGLRRRVISRGPRSLVSGNDLVLSMGRRRPTAVQGNARCFSHRIS